jgi:hypothetical protein
MGLWLLRRLGPGHSDAMAGDLMEQFGEGRSRVWFWKEVGLGVAAGWRGYVPEVLYALTMTAAPLATPRVLLALYRESTGWWGELPWPLSQLVFELGPPLLATLAPLVILALGLRLSGRLRWGAIARTGFWRRSCSRHVRGCCGRWVAIRI